MKLRMVLILATMVLGGMLLSGVVLAKPIKGGSGNDTLPGTNSKDYIKGNGGNDDINGKEGEDHLYGGKGKDNLRGGRGIDWIWGDAGADTAYGNQGYDHLYAEYPSQGSKGSIQAAKIKGGRKPDVLLGGRGNDTIRAKNGKKDIVRGGPGRDTAYVDPVDTVKAVEVKRCSGCTTSPGNNRPVANNDCYNADSDDRLNVGHGDADLLSNDTDADNTNNPNAGLTVKDANPNTKKIDPASGPSHATFFKLNKNGSFEYNIGQNDSPSDHHDSFTYKATDGFAESDVATVDINFSSGVDVPVGGAPCQP
jgi:Ca2+-binding RTX toxin-like protein